MAGNGVLYLIGLGLGDEKDITVRGLEAIRRCKAVYLEAYTSILGVEKDKLEEYYGCPVTLMDREAVEQECDAMLEMSKTDEVAFLVVGDVYGATTHTDMAVRAKSMGVTVKVIHNASIMNACAACGLQLYNFGQTVSICFFTDNWRPYSFVDKLVFNMRNNLHTLCLVDIKVKEQSEENMARGRKIYEPPRFMTVNQALEQIMECVENREDIRDVLSADTFCVGMARVGQETQVIASGPLKLLKDYDFGPPLHSLVIPGEMHYLEEEMLKTFVYLTDDAKPTAEAGPSTDSEAGPSALQAQAETEKTAGAKKEEGGSGEQVCLAELATRVLNEPDAEEKAKKTIEYRRLWLNGVVKVPHYNTPPSNLKDEPARPPSVQMVHPTKVKQGSKVAFIHSLCHAESYAIDLMWDIIARFVDQDLPKEFYDDWSRVAADEARHFGVWKERLEELGSGYGQFTAHDSLWASAQDTAHDLLARLAIVHMVHEARGLDVASIGLAKLMRSNPPDTVSAAILETNVEEEITHVGAAVKWFSYICEKRGLGEPEKLFHEYVRKFFRGALKPPFNIEFRQRAGMSEAWYVPLAEKGGKEEEEEEKKTKEKEEEETAHLPKVGEEEEEEDSFMQAAAGQIDDFFDAINS